MVEASRRDLAVGAPAAVATPTVTSARESGVTRDSCTTARLKLHDVKLLVHVSEWDCQGAPHRDLPWWRAEGADLFGPLGPAILRGVDYDTLLLQTRTSRLQPRDGIEVAIEGSGMLRNPIASSRT